MLNKQMINEVQFDKSKNGYDQTQVDAFLDSVELDYAQFELKIAELTAKLQKLQEENESIKISQSSIQSVLVSAQKLADEIVDKARVDAQNIIDEANIAANKINQQSDAEKVAAEQTVKQMIAEAAKKSEGMITAAHDSVARQQILFDELKQQISNFKNDIKAKYKEHIELLAQIPDAVPGNAAEAAAAVKNLMEQEKTADGWSQDADFNMPNNINDEDLADEDQTANDEQTGFKVNIPLDDSEDDLSEDEQDDEISFGKSKFFRKNK